MAKNIKEVMMKSGQRKPNHMAGLKASIDERVNGVMNKETKRVHAVEYIERIANEHPELKSYASKAKNKIYKNTPFNMGDIN